MVLKHVVEIVVDLVPVNNVPPSVDVLGTPVLVLEVVCVLPDVQAENRVHYASLEHALHERIVLV